MLGFFLFTLPLAVCLVAISFFVTLKPFKRRVKWAAALTIISYRLFTYLTIFFLGNTDWWRRVYTDSFNHYELGLLLITVTYIFYKLIKPALSDTLFGIASGLIIDEITDLLKFLPHDPLPPHFRDSPLDLALILFTFLIFVLITRLLSPSRSS